MHGGGHVVVLLVLAIVCCGGLIDVSRRGLAAHRGGSAGKRPKTGGWLAHRRALHLERTRHENASTRDEAKHKHRLAEQEAARQAKADGGGPRGGTVRGKVVRLGDEPAPAPGAGKPKPGDPPAAPTAGSKPAEPTGPPDAPKSSEPSQSTAPGDPSQRPASSVPPASPQQPPARNGAAPAAATAAPGPVQSQPPRGSTVSIIPGAEQVVDGINGIAAHARAGNILAKRRAMLALIHLCERAANMARNLAMALAEPGMHYGNEVTEPIAKGAAHLSAASMAFAESDSALSSLLRASLAETMAAGRQVPHHTELTETGAR
jgi:hypothetical protein